MGARNRTDPVVGPDSVFGINSGADSDSGVDFGADSGVDSGADFGVDSGADFGVDTGADFGVDSGADFGVDSGADSESEIDSGIRICPGVKIGSVIGDRI